MTESRTNSDIFQCVYDAGNPYFKWLWGSEKAAKEQVRVWMERPTSELSSDRVTVLEDSGIVAGAFIGLSPKELLSCRKADFLAILQYAKRSGDKGCFERMQDLSGLFAPVGEHEYYLSRFAVAPGKRGQGWGKKLLERFFAQGKEAGFSAFRLDVSADNKSAISLYETNGFQIVNRGRAKTAPLEYLSMAASI